MSKGKTQNPTLNTTRPQVNPKAFAGVQRVEIKVLKPGGFDPVKAVRRLRDGK